MARCVLLLPALALVLLASVVLASNHGSQDVSGPFQLRSALNPDLCLVLPGSGPLLPLPEPCLPPTQLSAQSLQLVPLPRPRGGAAATSSASASSPASHLIKSGLGAVCLFVSVGPPVLIDPIESRFLGLRACNASDTTQHFAFDPVTAGAARAGAVNVRSTSSRALIAYNGQLGYTTTPGAGGGADTQFSIVPQPALAAGACSARDLQPAPANSTWPPLGCDDTLSNTTCNATCSPGFSALQGDAPRAACLGGRWSVTGRCTPVPAGAVQLQSFLDGRCLSIPPTGDLPIPSRCTHSLSYQTLLLQRVRASVNPGTGRQRSSEEEQEEAAARYLIKGALARTRCLFVAGSATSAASYYVPRPQLPFFGLSDCNASSLAQQFALDSWPDGSVNIRSPASDDALVYSNPDGRFGFYVAAGRVHPDQRWWIAPQRDIVFVCNAQLLPALQLGSWPAGACRDALPGADCSATCPTNAGRPDAAAPVTTCLADGSWSAVRGSCNQN